MNPIVLFDVDDVIVDWRGTALSLIGPQAQEICDAFQRNEHHPGEVDLWELIRAQPTFWLDLPMNPWARDLIKFVEGLGIEWFFCTAHSKNDHRSATQKLEWCEKHGWCPHEKMVITKQKWLCAAPDTILIDDKDSNVREFIWGGRFDQKPVRAGGHAIVMPQPWNAAKDFVDSRQEFVEAGIMHYSTLIKGIPLG